MKRPSISDALRIARKRYADGGAPWSNVYEQSDARKALEKLQRDIAARNGAPLPGQPPLHDPNPSTKTPDAPSAQPQKTDEHTLGGYEPVRVPPTIGGGGDGFGASYGNAPSGQQPSNMPDAIDLTTGQPQQSTNPISTAFNNAVSNPASTAINAAVGFIPGVGLVNTAAGVANMFGAGLPTAGSLATGTYGQQAAPAGMPGVIDLNTSLPSIGPGRADATLSNIADKGNNAIIGVGPYGPYTQADVNAMANMMAGEAGNQGAKGMAAVGAVAGNRAVSNYNNYGTSIQSQIGRPGQFLGYNSSNAKSIMSGTDPQSKAVANQALATAQGVLSGSIPSPVGKATDFNQNTGVGAKGATNVQDLGAHTFFNAPTNYAGQTSREQAVQQGLDQVQQQQQQQQQQEQQAAPPAPSAAPPAAAPPAAFDPNFDAQAPAPAPAPTDPAAFASLDFVDNAPPAPAAPEAPTGVTSTIPADPAVDPNFDAPPAAPAPAPVNTEEDPNAQPSPDLVSTNDQLDMGPAFGLSLGLDPSAPGVQGTNYASLSPGTVSDGSYGQSISDAAYGSLADQNSQVNALNDAISQGLDNNSGDPSSDPGADPGADPGSDGADGGDGGDGGGDVGGGGGGDGGGGGEKRGGFIRPKHRASGGMVEKALKAVDDHRYKLRKHADWGKHQEYKSSGGKISQMSPTEFLNKTEKMRMTDDDKDGIHRFKKKIKKGKSLNPLAIFPKGGQDGRHRAMAAKELGIKKVPVITWPGKSEGGSIVDRALVVASKSANRQRGRP